MSPGSGPLDVKGDLYAYHVHVMSHLVKIQTWTSCSWHFPFLQTMDTFQFVKCHTSNINISVTYMLEGGGDGGGATEMAAKPETTV